MSMKHSLILQKEKILHRVKRGDKKKKFLLPISLDVSDSILICLPENNQKNYSRIALADEYNHFFSTPKIVFSAPSIFQSELSTVKNCVYYNLAEKYSVKNISTLFYHQVKDRPFRLAIDLNVEFSLVPALICKITNAPIRISFSKKNAEIFYNILIAQKTENSTFKQLQQLLKNNLITLIIQDQR